MFRFVVNGVRQLRTFSTKTSTSIPLSAEAAADEFRQSVNVFANCMKFVGIVWAFDTYGFHLTMTQGPSMLPTLNELGDLVIVDRLSTRWNPITRNDIITAGSPSRETDYRVCKRVIGLPGDEVWMTGKAQPVVVPAGHYWIEGDNPHNSTDSRHYGPVPQGLVHGRVVARIWPPTQACWFDRSQGRPTYNSLMFNEMLKDERIVSYAKHRRDLGLEPDEPMPVMLEETTIALATQSQVHQAPGSTSAERGLPSGAEIMASITKVAARTQAPAVESSLQ